MRLLRAAFWAVGSRTALLGLGGSLGSFPDGSSLLAGRLAGWRRGGGGRTRDGRASISGLYFHQHEIAAAAFAHAHCDVLLMLAAPKHEGGRARSLQCSF